MKVNTFFCKVRMSWRIDCQLLLDNGGREIAALYIYVWGIHTKIRTRNMNINTSIFSFKENNYPHRIDIKMHLVHLQNGLPGGIYGGSTFLLDFVSRYRMVNLHKMST